MFKPGQSGNPGGRRKLPEEMVGLARKHTVEAIETLAKIMQDTKAPAAARVSAASTILDRGWGKAMQPSEMTGKDGAPLIPSLQVVIARE